MATYTITETVTGKKEEYKTHDKPPGFVVTTVSCPACKPTEIEITCPGAQPTASGEPKPTVHITGNGVTATITAYPTNPPMTKSKSIEMETKTKEMEGKPKDAEGKTKEVESKPKESQTKATEMESKTMEKETKTKTKETEVIHYSTPTATMVNSNYPTSTPSSQPSPCSGSGSCPGSSAGLRPIPSVVPSSGPGCSGSACARPSSNGTTGTTGTTSTPSQIVTAGAPSLKNAFAVFSGLAFVAGHFFLL